MSRLSYGYSCKDDDDMAAREFSKSGPPELLTAKVGLSNKQKHVAHKLVMGATVKMVAQEMRLSESVIERWTYTRSFLHYMAKIEKRLYDSLERRIITLRRGALKVLESSLASDDMMERRWAVEKILHVTEDKTLNLNINDGRVDDRPALSDNGKAAAKAYYAELAQQRETFFKDMN
jgi:hypothetical protein